MAETFTAEAKLNDLLTAKFKAMEGNINSGFKKMEKEAKDFSEKTKRSLDGGIKKGLTGVKVAALALSAVATGALVNSFINAQRSIDKVNRTLKVGTGSAKSAATELEFLTKESARLGLEVQSTALNYAQFAAAAKNSSLTTKQQRDIFIGVSEASAAMGLTASDATGAMRALQQMMSKGTVQAEELRGQLGERIPGAFGMAAKAMGLTEKQLGKQLELGNILAADLLPKLAAEMSKTFGPEASKGPETLNGKINALKNIVFNLQKQILDAGFKEILIDVFDLAAKSASVLGKGLIGLTKIVKSIKDEFGSGPKVGEFMKNITEVEKVQSMVISLQQLNDVIKTNNEVIEKGNLSATQRRQLTIDVGKATKEQISIIKQINLIAGKGSIDRKTNLETFLNVLDQEKEKLSAKQNQIEANIAAEKEAALVASKKPTEKVESEKTSVQLDKTKLFLQKKAELEHAEEAKSLLRVLELSQAKIELMEDGREKELALLQLQFDKRAEVEEKSLQNTLQRQELFKIKSKQINDAYDSGEKKKADKFNAEIVAGKKALTDNLISQSSRGLQAFTKNEKAAKKISLVTSIIQGALAVQRALASAPPPLNFINAAATGIVAAGNSATIAAQAFENGGIISGGRQLIQTNEAGQESVLNARATANQGVGGINALNSGQPTQNTTINGISFSPTINIDGGDKQTVVDAIEGMKPQFATFLQEEIFDKGYVTVNR